MGIVYDIFYLFFMISYAPVIILKGKWHKGLGTRWGQSLESRREFFKKSKCLWVHAVSVGEVMAASQVIRKLMEEYPQHHIVFSTVTETGHKLALEKFSNDVQVIFAPFDFSWTVRSYIKKIKPDMYISCETEIWPNLYTELFKQNIPILIINGRISEKAFKRYAKIKFVMKRILSYVTVFCMQAHTDSKRIIAMGADQLKVNTVGNLKFDSSSEIKHAKLEDYQFKKDDELLIAGSTHPGEEEILIDTFLLIKDQFPHLRLVLAPRHIERTESIEGVIERKGFHALRLSQSAAWNKEMDQKIILVIDTIGQLQLFYTLAKVVFIGKTLTVGGGQNIIEPASYGKPVIVGPDTQNFADIVKLFLDAKAIIQVQEVGQLRLELVRLLSSADLAQSMGIAAQNVIRDNKGATIKTINFIKQTLSK